MWDMMCSWTISSRQEKMDRLVSFLKMILVSPLSKTLSFLLMILSTILHLVTGELAFNVTVGSFRYVSGAVAANNAGAVKITTPSATITVRGTTLTGNVTPGGATTITLLRDARWWTRFCECS